MPVGVAAAARAMALARSRTKTMASCSDSAPARAVAVISPTEWPASTVLAGSASSEQGAGGNEAGGHDQRLGDGGVLDGFLIRDGAVGGQVALRDGGECGEVFRKHPELQATEKGIRGSGSPVQGTRLLALLQLSKEVGHDGCFRTPT